jgi:hypothetical protein
MHNATAKVRLVHEAQYVESRDDEGIEEKLEPVLHVGLADCAHRVWHLHAIDVDNVDDVLGELVQEAVEVAGLPSAVGAHKRRALLVQRHGGGPPGRGSRPALSDTLPPACRQQGSTLRCVPQALACQRATPRDSVPKVVAR